MNKAKLITSVLTFILVISLLSNCINAQQKKLLSKEEKTAYIEKAAKLLNDNYVFPDVAQKIEKHLKSQLAKGEFNKIEGLQEFALKLTTEMQFISKDKHMQCSVRSMFAGNQTPLRPNIEIKGLKEERNLGFARAGKLENNIGYFDIFNFPPMQRAKDLVDAAMRILAQSEALIIDLRRNTGGNPDLIQYICSYFFDKPTHINSIYWRSSNSTIDFITFEKVDGKKMGKVPIFILTSSYTFSGGEEFAYNIQTQKRGVLIGEITRGGANPGGSFPISDELSLFIPTGRAINPITKTNWEGTGVIPDIKIETSKAFEIAFEKASKR